MRKLLLFVFCTPNWSDTKDILSCGTMHSDRYAPTFQSTLPPPLSGWWRQQVPLRWCYICIDLQWLDQGDKQHHYYHLENLMSQQVLEIAAKIWVIWDCKFRYLIVVYVSSVSGWLPGVICLWLRSELTAVTPCSLINMCQDCNNWAQERKYNF